MPTLFRSGYTLVELLIVITIVALLITLGLTAYGRGAEIQARKSATELILSTLTAAQKDATSGNKDCSGAYLGERIVTTVGSANLQLTSLCQGATGSTRTITLNNFTFASNASLVFRPLNQGIDTGGSDILNLDYTDASGVTYRIQITRSGSLKVIGEVE